MTERIKKLRAVSVGTHPRLSTERAIIETRCYADNEGRVSIPELRALTLLYINSRRELYIGDGELIIGEKGNAPQTAPTFPELCCHTLDDMRIMDGRPLISFSVAEEEYKAQRETIIPFWEKRSMRHKIFGLLPDDWKDCYESGIFTEFMEQRGPGHTVGSVKIYEKGFLDYKADIKAALDALDYEKDGEAVSKREQLSAMSITCDAIITLGERYAALARERAANEADETRRRELYDIAEVCDVVPAHRPQTFRQALQMYWFVHLCVTTELNPWDSYSPGRLDQHLRPFYESDIKSGILTDEAALELLECLWIKFNNQPAPPKVGITLKESGTYTDFANINTGGVAPDGSDGVNRVSYLILDCMDEMRLLQPSSNVQISVKTPDAFVSRAAEISRKGWGQPAFYNTEAIISELLNAGKSLEDAYKGGTSGCVETGAFGSEAYILTGYLNLPKIAELAMNDGFDARTGRQLGPHTGFFTDFDGFDALYAAFETQLKHFVDIKIRGSNLIEQLYARYMPAPFLSVITNDCIARGKDYNAGGARYNTSYIQGVGIGTVTDSLSAVKYCVYDNALMSRGELAAALTDNFSGFERERALLRSRPPRYGNDDDYADDIMRRVFKSYYGCVTGRPNTRGGSFRINMLPTTCHIWFGEVTGATPNGRLSGKPLSEGISPSQGADIKGPTAVLKSCGKMAHALTGGTLLNQKFTPRTVEGEDGLTGMTGLIRGYFALGGHHVQFNVCGRETLYAAQQSPEDYGDLIVRVAGYSDYFNNLSRALQDEIIERTEQEI